MFDKTLRDDEHIYSIARPFSLATGQSGAVWRMGMVTLAGLALVPAAPQHTTRIVLQLLVPLVGAALAWLHPQESRLVNLSMLPPSRLSRLTGAQAIARTLTGAAGRATINLAGAAEYSGLVSMVLLVSGPWPVPLPHWAWLTGMALAVGFGWGIGRGVMLDSSWYRPDVPAAAFFRFTRVVFPLFLAAVALGIFLSAPSTLAVTDPQRWVPNALAACAFLTLYPLTLNYEETLRAGRRALAPMLAADRQRNGRRVHSMVKNPLRLLQKEIAPNLEVIGFHAQHYLQNLEYFLNDVTRDIESGSGSLRGSMREIFEGVQDIFPSRDRDRISFDDSSNVTDLQGNDYDLVRTVLLDLVTNAMKADARTVRVRVTRQGTPAQLAVTVTDDAPGMVVVSPRSSLESLKRLLRNLGAAGLYINDDLTDGKIVTASWLAERSTS
ncbi:ATP-binding protein [Streptomyces pseudovenezuelae]|uniref:ATP-binding protein n=1 Tax=Streptomyces pseudovenezuelae TaxID=67350 RepID=UPI003724AE96